MQNPTIGQVLLVVGFVAFFWFYFLWDSGVLNSDYWYAIGLGTVIGLLVGLSGIGRRT
jgi:hypothetical protein